MSDTSYESSDDMSSVVGAKSITANLLAVIYVMYMFLAGIGVVLGLGFGQDSPVVCPESLTFWTRFNFVFHACLFLIWGVLAIVVKLFGIFRFLVVVDCALLVLGCIVAIIGTTQNVVGLYKAIGHDCDTVVDLAVWQILLFGVFMSTVSFCKKL
jgi:hypothetical protein